MESNSKKKTNLILLSSLAIIIVGLIIAVVYFVHQSHEKDAEMAEVTEAMNFEKEQVEKEYSELNKEFDGYTSNIHNDSLIKLLDDQKIKVQQLLNELRVTKSTNARKIAQLKQELATVRAVMIQYVNQIDSLNSMNKKLKTENIEVHRKYQAASETVEQLSKEKDNLNQKVTRAAILEVTNFSMTPLNSKNKKTNWFTKTANLQFHFTIGKNVTAQTGEKKVYLRITRPDDDVLTKNSSNLFQYEDKRIAYSAMKEIEYSGESVSDVMYWKVEEILPKGNYRAEFFIDGYRVGSFSFVFEK